MLILRTPDVLLINNICDKVAMVRKGHYYRRLPKATNAVIE